MWSRSPVRVRAPATSANLGPGFDALGLALRLHDEVEARITGDGLVIDVAGEGENTAASGDQHLVVRAMRTAFDAMDGQPPGIALRCVNAIPHGRGLGSSAAAVCSGILAARALASDGEARLPSEAVFRLAVAMEGHPDNVAACLAGGLTIAWTPRTPPVTGLGGAAEARLLRVPVPTTLRAVVCVPPVPLATEEARRVLPSTVSHADAAANAARSALLVAALTGAPEVLFEATEDFLHQPYRAAVMPQTATLISLLREAGVAAVVSGAGPSVLALTFADSQQGADAVGSIAGETGIAWRVIPLDIDRQGAHVRSGELDVYPPGSARQRPSWSQVQGPGAGHAGGSPQDRSASSGTH